MWARLASALLGVWLMAAPAVLGYGPPAAISDRIAGPLAASFAIVSIWEVVRALRWATFAVGLWVLIGPLVLGYGGAAAANGVGVGILLLALSCVRGRLSEDFGGGWSSLWGSGAGPDSGTPAPTPSRQRAEG